MSLKSGWLSFALLAIPLASAASNDVPVGAPADVAAIMPPLAHPPLAMPIRSAQQTNVVNTPSAVYSEAAFPAVTAEFSRFRESNKRVTFEQASRQGSVQTRAEFARMHQYLDNAYNGVTVVKTIRIDGQIYDCIPTREQPALRGGAVLATPPDGSIPGIQNNSQAGRSEVCGAGTVPFARLDMRDLMHYPSLDAFLHKGKHDMPSQQHGIKPAASTGHHYAVVITHPSTVNGGAADLNIWNPPVNAGTDQYRMSLSQIWLVGADPSGKSQTLEVGWQVQPKSWNTANAVPFIYSTQDGYNKTGCYNLQCVQFVQTSNSVVFGSSFASNQYSVAGGSQPVMSVQWYWDASSSAWWLSINGSWIGYYPASVYGTGTVASGGNSLLFEAGGEIAAPDGTPSLPMGSGQFAAKGYQYAAFVANMFYIDGSSNAYYSDLTQASLYPTDPACYTLAMAGESSGNFPNGLPNGVSTIALNSQMSGNGFYMGGPGCSK